VARERVIVPLMPATDIPTVTLNTGVAMPLLGFGVYQIPPEAMRSRP
jgi:2,5-diketo-D-gluconate reductase A